MQANSITGKIMPERASVGPRPTQNIKFSSILNQQMAPKNSGQCLEVNPGLKNGEMAKSRELVLLGTITQSDPTVSNLLIKHADYRKDCWRIIHSERNCDKPYRTIQAGTQIYIDPDSREIIWGKKADHSIMKREPISRENTSKPPKSSFSTGLVDAVKPYMGKAYEEVDCYELVVNGLEKMGIRYRGAHGLKNRLVKMAVEKGLPDNTYISDEGLIKASGSPVYSRSILRIDNPETQANHVIKEMEPYLEKGLILSFSTHTKGHTGIVSKKDDTWTFINSRNMDHNIGIRGRAKGVGEETLSEEIRNWFNLAFRKNESLGITVGRLDESKLAAFYNKRALVSTRA